MAIYSDATVKYLGFRNVKTGRRTAKRDPATLAKIDAAFVHADFFALRDEYDHRSQTDRNSAIIFFDDGKRRKEVYHNLGDLSAPESLLKLEEEIDRLLESERFTGKSPAPW
jgi:hypothetical protein